MSVNAVLVATPEALSATVCVAAAIGVAHKVSPGAYRRKTTFPVGLYVTVAVSVIEALHVVVAVPAASLVMVASSSGGIAPDMIWLSRAPADSSSMASTLMWYGPPLMLPAPQSSPSPCCPGHGRGGHRSRGMPYRW